MMTRKQLYPKAPSRRQARRGLDRSRRRYRVHYKAVAVEGGYASWTGYHRTYAGARIAAWLNFTYGHGTVTLEDTRKPE